jgi:hypothetical protein
MSVEVVGKVPALAILLREQRLERVQRRKCLQLDEFWLDAPIRITHQAEVHLHEQRVIAFAGRIEFRRNRGVRRTAVLGIAEQLVDELGASVRQPVHELTRKKTGGLRDAKLDLGTAAPLKVRDERAVPLGHERGVEPAAQVRQQSGTSPRA